MTNRALTRSDLERARKNWCEHGWSWWHFHMWTLAWAALGSLGLESNFVYGLWLTGILGVWIGVALKLLFYPGVYFVGWLLVLFLGYFSLSNPQDALTMVIGFFWAISQSSAGSINERLRFSISSKSWDVFRMAVSLSLMIRLYIWGPHADIPSEISYAALSSVLLLTSWLRWSNLAQVIWLERLIVLLSLIWLALSCSGDQEISGPVILTLLACWNLRVWPPRRLEHAQEEWIFFDSTCALCQGTVALVLVEDWRTTPFFFAPQTSSLFQQQIQSKLKPLRETVYVLNDEKQLIAGEEAIEYILRSLGGGWLAMAWLLRRLPKRLTQWVYNKAVALRGFWPADKSCHWWPELLRHRLKMQAGETPSSTGVTQNQIQ